MTERYLFKLKFFNLLEMQGKQKVIAFCMETGLIAKEYECSICKKPMKFKERTDISDGYNWICEGNGPHRFKRSIRCGTIFEESRLSLIDILKIAYLFVKKTEVQWISDELSLSYKTVIEWTSLCQKLCVEALAAHNARLGGFGGTVEIYESPFKKSMCQKGNWNLSEWVFIGVERNSNKCFFELVQNRSKEVFLSVLKKFILPDSTVITDCLKIYNCLQDESFVHFASEHRVTIKSPETGESASSVENLWKNTRCSKNIKIRRKDDDVLHLAEHMLRRLYGHDYQALFKVFLKTIIEVFPPQTKDNEKLLKKRKISEGGELKRICSDSSSKENNLDSSEN